MPKKLRVCAEFGCADMSYETRCEKHRRLKAAEYRNRSLAWSWVYRDKRWAPLRRKVLAEQPICARIGCENRSTEVDHKVGLRDGGAPFDRINLQALCHGCHSAKTLEEVRA